jgi:peptide/nickel transport system substrate-binding protein
MIKIKLPKYLIFLTLALIMLTTLTFFSCTTGTTTTSSVKPTSSTSTSPVTTPVAATKTTSSTTQSTTPVATTAANAPQKGGTLKIITGQLVPQIGSPADAAGQMTFQWWARPVYDNLLTRDINGNIKPGLAESWDISSNGTSVTLNLKKGVKFQDNTDFNAAAVKYNLEKYAANPAGKAALSSIKSIDVVNDNTVRLNLTKYDHALLCNTLSGMAGFIASPAAMEKTGTADAVGQLHMVGTGPFKLVSYQRDVAIKFARWDGYWDKGKPYLDAIEIINYADPTSAVMAFKAGEAHMINAIMAKDATSLKAVGFKTSVNDAYYARCLFPDSKTSNSPFANQKVREAVQYAMDVNTIAQKIIGPEGFVGITQLATSSDAWYVSGLNRDFNVQKAKQLMSEAGFADGFSTTLYSMSGTDPTDLSTAIQSYLAAVGIKANIQMTDSGKMFGMMVGGFQNGLLGFVLTGGISGVTSAKNYYPTTAKPADFAQLIDSITSEVNDAKRLELTKTYVKAMFDYCMMMPVFANYEIQAYNPSVNDLDFGKSYTNWQPGNAWLSTKK